MCLKTARPKLHPVEGQIAEVKVMENQEIAERVEAKDPDPQSLVYLISGGTDATLFKVSPATGLVSFISPLILKTRPMKMQTISMR